MQISNVSRDAAKGQRGVRRLLGVATVLGAMVLSACGGSASSEDEMVRVLFVAGQSGPTAQIVSEVSESIEAAIDEINEEGGIDGREMTFELLDSEGDPTRAVSELQRRLSEGERPDLVIPGVSSVEALALTPLLTRERIVSINNAASPELNRPEEYPYHFGYTPTPDQQQLGLVAGLQELGAESVVALLGNDAYGSALTDAITELLDGSGIDLQVEEFNLTDLDLSISYERAISSNPDAVFLEAIGDPAQRLVEARQVVGATHIPTIGGFGINSTNGGPSQWASDEANENLYTQIFASQVYVAPEQRSEGVAEFFERIEQHGGVQNSVQAPFIFYDVVRIYATAATAAGSTDAEAVTAQLEGDMPYPDLTFWSQHRWSADNHFPSPSAEEFAIVPQGELVDGMFKPVDDA